LSNTKSKLCFVVSPIGTEDSEERIHADWLLEEIIQPVMAEFPDYRVKRADYDLRPGLIDSQMINDLLNADLVIADLSLHNPNVFYEIGIRHMAQKPIIHMQLASERPPFDVSLYRAIGFARTKPRDLRAARAELKGQVEAVLADGYEVENPVTNARGRIKLKEHATPEQQVLIDQMQAMQDQMQAIQDQLRRLDRPRPPRPQVYSEVERPRPPRPLDLPPSGTITSDDPVGIGDADSSQFGALPLRGD
jgi:hypothetical protein